MQIVRRKYETGKLAYNTYFRSILFTRYTIDVVTGIIHKIHEGTNTIFIPGYVVRSTIIFVHALDGT